jgi:hypothetical protein
VSISLTSHPNHSIGLGLAPCRTPSTLTNVLPTESSIKESMEARVYVPGHRRHLQLHAVRSPLSCPLIPLWSPSGPPLMMLFWLMLVWLIWSSPSWRPSWRIAPRGVAWLRPRAAAWAAARSSSSPSCSRSSPPSRGPSKSRQGAVTRIQDTLPSAAGNQVGVNRRRVRTRRDVCYRQA